MQSYAKNTELLRHMEVLDSLLGEVEISLYDPSAAVELPLVLVVGCPRSGTTLITQWLAASGAFAYPTNFVSRFHRAPVIAYLIQELVANPAYQYGAEFSDIRKGLDFRSHLGKTAGFLAPHGFWFFWRRFFQFPDIPCDEFDFDLEADYRGFIKAIGNWQTYSQKPIFLKATIANYYFSNIYFNVQNVYVIYIKRDIYSTTHSLLRARELCNGSRDTWWAYKPSDYYRLLTLPPEQQVIHQYLSINGQIEKQIARIDDSRRIHIDYDTFCSSDRARYEDEIRDKIRADMIFPSLDISYSKCEDEEHISYVDQYMQAQELYP